MKTLKLREMISPAGFMAYRLILWTLAVIILLFEYNMLKPEGFAMYAGWLLVSFLFIWMTHGILTWLIKRFTKGGELR